MAPATSRHQAADAASIAQRVIHAWQIIDSYVSALPGGVGTLRSARVLELGPGPSLGAAVLLACHGATVTTADPYVATWDDHFHVPFFEALLTSVRERGDSSLDEQPLIELLRARAFVPDVVRRLNVDAESLDACPSHAFDLVVSCAVLEHVRDVPAALRQLARITKPGGVGVHIVDFRDHRDFSKPLEYLRLPSPFFWRMFDLRWGECGNRWRSSSMTRAFVRAGFAIDDTTPHITADEPYLQAMRPRLHGDFAELSDEDLRLLCATITCTRTERPALIVSERTAGLTPPPRHEVLPAPEDTYRRIAVYGAGSGAFAALDLLDRLGWTPRVTAVCDGNPEKVGTTVAGLDVTRFDTWEKGAFDLVIVASEPGQAAISALLTSAGLFEAPAFRELGFIAAFTPIRASEAAA